MKLKFLILSILVSSYSWSQIQVTGRVLLRSDHLPLPGVNVLEKNAKNGTSTDSIGNFSINVTDKNSTLVFHFIGCKSQEVNLKEQIKIEVTMEEDCIIDWFDVQKIGFYLNSGVINNPIGAQFNFTFPAIFGEPTLKTEISYQTNLKENRFLNVGLSLKHLFVSCDFNTDVNSSYRDLNYDNKLNFSGYSLETNLNFKKITVIAGVSTVKYHNLKDYNVSQRLGAICGLEKFLPKPFLASVSAKAIIYNNLIEYKADVNKRYKNLYGFLRFYKVEEFNELSIGIGIETTYHLKNHR